MNRAVRAQLAVSPEAWCNSSDFSQKAGPVDPAESICSKAEFYIIEVALIVESVPHILSVGTLDVLGAVLDLVDNQLSNFDTGAVSSFSGPATDFSSNSLRTLSQTSTHLRLEPVTPHISSAVHQELTSRINERPPYTTTSSVPIDQIGPQPRGSRPLVKNAS